MSHQGRFLVFEGIDGCGKSTQAVRIAEQWGAVSTFEPGATELGRSLRTLILGDGEAPAARTEALLIAADRAQHVATVIEPALQSSRDVVSDRYYPSTVAYQGFGRGLPRREIDELIDFATGGLEADLVILLDLPVEVAVTRRGGAPDRMEANTSDFFERVRLGYLEMAKSSPERWAVIDATASLDAVTAQVDQVLAERGLS